MFKERLRYKIIAMFLLLVLSVMIIAGTVLFTRVGNYYADRFTNDMSQVFSDETVVSELNGAGANSDTNRIYDILQLYSGSGRLGINQNRNFYILNATDGTYIKGTDDESGGSLTKTKNIISAMSGRTGDSVSILSGTMDYAYPVINNGTVKYVIYINDNCAEVTGILENIFWIILSALGWGVAISLIVGLFLSKNITGPIVALTRRAEKLTWGEEKAPESTESKAKATDEIEILSSTFNEMSEALFSSLTQMEGEKTKMETILVNLTDGVIAFDTDGKVIHINPAATKMLSIFDPALVDFNVLFNDIGADIHLGDILYLEQNKTFERTINLNSLVLKAYFAAFKMESPQKYAGRAENTRTEKAGGVVVALQDITEQERLDRSRKEFVANVSHELRTPLTSIKSYTETLMDSSEKDSMEYRFLGVVNTEVDRMTRMVKDLLTLSRLDHTQGGLRLTKINIRSLLEGVVMKQALNAKAKNHTLQYVPTTGIPTYTGDKDKLEQVIINLVSNSIKYTPEGGTIEIFAGKVYNDIYIKVKDNGIGIPKADLDRIFERFYRVDKARSRKEGGTGLGLAIAKEIVEAHGGNISITSTVNKGSEVIITLPLDYNKKPNQDK